MEGTTSGTLCKISVLRKGKRKCEFYAYVYPYAQEHIETRRDQQIA